MRLLTYLLLLFTLFSASLNAILVTSFTHNGHTYEIYDDLRSWDNARSDATGRTLFGQQGYLVEIESAAENTVIFNQLTANNTSFTQTASDGGGARYVWTGGNDIASEGTWVWNSNNTQYWNGSGSGNPVAGRFNNWGSGPFGSEPDNFNNNQDAAAIALDGWPSFSPGGLGNAGQWNDIATSNTMPYIIEYNVIPEPASALLFGIFSVFGLLLFQKQKRNRFKQIDP